MNKVSENCTQIKRIGLEDPIGKITFQAYRAPITNTRPKADISFHDFLSLTQEATAKLREVFFQIAVAEAAGDMERKAMLKQDNLHFFSPCVYVDPTRSYKNINHFTGLLVLDWDHIDHAHEFKQFVFETYRCVAAIWLSPSRKGVKAIIRIPVVSSVEEFKKYFWGLAAEMDQYSGFDTSSQNCVLPLFQSFDPDLLDRNDPETWTIRGTNPKELLQPSVPPPTPNVNATGRQKAIVLSTINTGFNRISAPGHPALRSLCLAIGGYVAAGYIDYQQAMELIKWRISTHHYLKKGISGYQNTAKWAVNQGMKSPLYL